MKIERANLAIVLQIGVVESIRMDCDAAIKDGRGAEPGGWYTDRTHQILKAIQAIENGEQLEIVD